MKEDYNYYNDFGCNYIDKFQKRNPEFNNSEFEEFVIARNRGDRDSGEIMDIAKHEILRIAYEWVESKWRFPSCYNRNNKWNK